MKQYVPSEQLWSSDWAGDMDFEYDHDVYWPSLNELCKQRREAKLARWRAAGAIIGESEDYLAGGTDTSISGFKFDSSSVENGDLEKKMVEATLHEKQPAGEVEAETAAAVVV